MIPYEEAIQIVLQNVKPIGEEQVDLFSAGDRILREDIISDIDNPPFDNSAMDGYAVKAADTVNANITQHVILKVKGITAAGGTIEGIEIHYGEAIGITTGAPVPYGADAVLIIENTEKVSDTEIKVLKPVTIGENIRFKGEDLKKGELILSSGTKITPSIIALLATVGRKTMRVSKKPEVGIVATGNELVEPEYIPPAGKIRNCNAYFLYSQIIKEGGVPTYYGIAGDLHGEIEGKISEALSNSDIVITTGGVSVGEFDYVKESFSKLGIDIKFLKVAIKPGKPTVFGVKGDTCIFGLPGNPVSTLVTFNRFVSPCIAKMMGNVKPDKKVIPCILNEDLTIKSDRKQFVRIHIEQKGDTIMARSTGHQGSGRLKSIFDADGIMTASPGEYTITKGTKVIVELL